VLSISELYEHLHEKNPCYNEHTAPVSDVRNQTKVADPLVLNLSLLDKPITSGWYGSEII
jgi:hypothetical protein